MTTKPLVKPRTGLAKKIGWTSMLVLSLFIVLVSSRYFSLNPDVFFSEQMLVYMAHRFGLILHISGAMLALLIGPLQFLPRLRRGRFLKLHRWLGRIYLLGILLGGLGGLYMAFFAFGGIVAKLGFASLSLLWLGSGYAAYSLIRKGNIEAHKAWMIRNFALTFAAVTLRLWIPLFMMLGLEFRTSYIIISWLCWVPNLIFAEWLIRRDSRKTTPLPSLSKVDA